MHNIDISELRICLSAHLARVWNDMAPNPRVCPSAGARLCTYLRWFAQPTNNKADLLRLPLPRKAMVSFLRFRTVCHALPNVIGTRTGVPRSQRLCPLCQAPYSDERHTLLECCSVIGGNTLYAWGIPCDDRRSFVRFSWRAPVREASRYIWFSEEGRIPSKIVGSILESVDFPGAGVPREGASASKGEVVA